MASKPTEEQISLLTLLLSLYAAACDFVSYTPSLRLGTIHEANIASVAFQAYKNPSEFGPNLGITECSTEGTCVTHFNRDDLDRTMHGVLKIKLKNAKNLRDADVGVGKSDPYVVFSSGASMTRSEVKKETLEPKWNSTHHIFIRTHPLFSDDSGEKLEIHVLDSDRVRRGNDPVLPLSRLLSRDGLLGKKKYNLKELMVAGEKEYTDVPLEGSKGKDKSAPPMISFTLEFISVEQYCKENNKMNPSYWLDERMFDNTQYEWANLQNMTPVGRASIRPIAFFDNVSGGTQGWLISHDFSKTLILAFRGTEIAQVKDVLADVKIGARPIADLEKKPYALHPFEIFKQPGVMVHAGFLNSYKCVQDSVLQKIYSFTEWGSDWSIVATGHSLGGAIATISAYDMANRMYSFLPDTSVRVDVDEICACRVADGGKPEVGMMSVGAPKVGNMRFVTNYDKSVPASFRVVNVGDLVHTVPLNFTHVNSEIKVHPDGKVDLQSRNIQCGFDATEMKEYHEQLKELNETPIGKNFLSFISNAASVKAHLQGYYFGLIKSAVEKFQKELKNATS